MSKLVNFDKRTDSLVIKFGGSDFKDTLQFVKGIPGVKFSPTMKHWYVKRTKQALDLLMKARFKIMGDAYTELVAPAQTMTQIENDLSKVTLDHIPALAREYQIDAVKEIVVRNNKALLCADPGLGKTLMASVWAANTIKKKPLLVICPSFLKEHWARELQKWVGMDSTALFSQSPYRFKWNDALLINYDILPFWVDALLDRCEAIICDESHYLANDTSERTKAVRRLHLSIPNRLFMSGTPIRSRPIQFWPQLNMLNKQIFNNKQYYLNRFCGPAVGYTGALEYKGATHLDELHTLVKTVMVRRTRAEVAAFLPKKNRVIYSVHVDMKKQDQVLDEELQLLLSQGKGDDAIFYEKMAQLSNSSFYYKKDFIIEHIHGLLETIPKLMIVGYHTTVIAELSKEFPGAAVISGKTPTGTRQRMVDDFNNKDTCRILIGQFDAAGVGFSMQNCHDMCLAEMVWVPGQLDQIESRILRLTSDGEQVNYYFYMGSGTVEEKMLDTITNKYQNASMVLDGESHDYFAGASYV